MPDAWETQYGLNPHNRFDAKLDPDGDKVANIDEYKAGTNPNDKNIDKNGDGVADDWMTFYKLTDVNADADGDGRTNKQEYEDATNPLDPNSVAGAAEAVSTARPTPSMAGVRANVNSAVPENHQVAPNDFVYNDPIGDDKGPGYYTYPTNPVYTPGSFDILSFEVDATGRDNIVFKITVNADLKQDWGMAADFDVQFFQIYIDQDRVPGSGEVRCLPGLNIFFAPEFAWDKVVLVSPQPNSRVQVELDVKAKDMEQNAVLPIKISGQGRTITAVVKRKDLGVAPGADISGWAWQVVAQSNEGYPDSDDLLTRNVNEYRGLHRFGGGSDYWGDPEMMDMLAWPALGNVQEAADQFAILNVWTSGPNPMNDTRAVVPLVANNETAQWSPNGGYIAFAKSISDKLRPPAPKDKYMSDSFNFSLKVFTRYLWNLNPASDNFTKYSLEVQFYSKVYSDLIDFYMRWEESNFDNTVWSTWHNSTPGQETIAVQSYRCSLVRPFPTVDMISLGNYDVNYNAWVAGAAWYPDRDKFKGLFVDGSVSSKFQYQVAAYYPLNWIGADWLRGKTYYMDFIYLAKIQMNDLIPGLKWSILGVDYTDKEVNNYSTDDPKPLIMRAYDLAAATHLDYKIGPFIVGGDVAFSKVAMSDVYKYLEIDQGLDLDANGVIGGLAGGGINKSNNTEGLAFVVNAAGNDFLGIGLTARAQYFNIDDDFVSFGAARGDTATSYGPTTASSADVLMMNGNQSAHRVPQAGDFVANKPMPVVPAQFTVIDEIGKIGIGWLNDDWEGVAAGGWKGFTGQLAFKKDVYAVEFEASSIGYNASDLSNTTELRGFAHFNLNLMGVGSGLFTDLFVKLDSVKDGTRDMWFTSPYITVSYYVTKTTMITFNPRYEYGDGFVGIDNAKFGRLQLNGSLKYSLPIGSVFLTGGYWREYDNDYYSSRTDHGAWIKTEVEFAM